MANKESDIDILVVIDTNHIKLSQEIKKTSDAIFLFIIELGKTISAIPVTKHTFENLRSLFFRNIRRDMQIL
jgi:predicted nucleotidyltransferase